MDQKKIMTVLRRAGLRLVKNNQSLHNQELKRPSNCDLSSYFHSISYQTYYCVSAAMPATYNNSPEKIIRHNLSPQALNLSPYDNSQGTDVAQAQAMPKDGNAVAIVKEYPRPEFNRKRTSDDIIGKIKAGVADLRAENAALKDRIRRLEEEIQSEIKMLTAALSENKQETVDQVRRRISRLKGSMEYPGRTDYKR